MLLEMTIFRQVASARADRGELPLSPVTSSPLLAAQQQPLRTASVEPLANIELL